MKVEYGSWWKELDPELKPVIEELWSEGFKTQGSSCAGHPSRKGVRMIGNIGFDRALDRRELEQVRKILKSYGLTSIRVWNKVRLYPNVKLGRATFDPIGG